MSESEQYDLLDRLAEEFAARFRCGERPALREYTDRYPELAEDIRELFPAMAQVEHAEGLRKDVEEIEEDGALNSPPKEIGDYRILREIGRGGMGVVYEAEQISLGRRVALKVLPRQVGDDRMIRERFRREARAAARLHHTNIVPDFEVGQDGDYVPDSTRRTGSGSSNRSSPMIRRSRGPSISGFRATSRRSY
jgi:serine/threonine protein kinase